MIENTCILENLHLFISLFWVELYNTSYSPSPVSEDIKCKSAAVWFSQKMNSCQEEKPGILNVPVIWFVPLNLGIPSESTISSLNDQVKHWTKIF